MTAIPDVIESTGQVVERAMQVTINQPVLQAWADAHRNHDFAVPAMPAELHFHGSRDECANLA